MTTGALRHEIQAITHFKPSNSALRQLNTVYHKQKVCNWHKAVALLFFFLRFYLFMRDTERGKDTGRGRSRLPARSLIWDLIPNPRITP